MTLRKIMLDVFCVVLFALGGVVGILRRGRATLVRSQLAPIEVNDKFLQKVRNKSFLKDCNTLPLCSEKLRTESEGGKINQYIFPKKSITLSLSDTVSPCIQKKIFSLERESLLVLAQIFKQSLFP